MTELEKKDKEIKHLKLLIDLILTAPEIYFLMKSNYEFDVYKNKKDTEEHLMTSNELNKYLDEQIKQDVKEKKYLKSILQLILKDSKIYSLIKAVHESDSHSNQDIEEKLLYLFQQSAICACETCK